MGRLQWLGNTLANCKQHGSSDDEYFGHLTKNWDEIFVCMNSKLCSCDKCECDLSPEILMRLVGLDGSESLGFVEIISCSCIGPPSA